MSNVRNYISNARNFANENYTNFSGNGNQFANLQGMANVGRRMQNADGGGNAPQAQPYIITLTNASAQVVNNFDVLGAFQYLQSSGFSNGSLTINGVTISSGIPNVSYQELLYQSMNQPFRVGLTYIQSLSGSAAQITTPFLLDTRDANGSRAQRLMTPTIAPTDFQQNIVALRQEFSIDGFTKLTFNSILPSVSVSIQLYAASTVNVGVTLQGGNPVQQYSNPNVANGLTLNTGR